MNNYKNFVEWAIGQHVETNHYYDKDAAVPLPYSYHLQLVVDVIEKFKSLIYALGLDYRIIVAAAWAHDTIEDARASYNDVKKAAMGYGNFNAEDAKKIAEIVRACTNVGRGRNRKERMPQECYDDIKSMIEATIVKLADRAGNLKHGILKGSNQKGMYAKENPHFKEQLYREDLKPMFDYVEKLINTEL